MKKFNHFIVLFAGIIICNQTTAQEQQLQPAESNRKWGFSNEKGELVIQAIYDMVYEFDGNYAIVAVKDKYGVIDQKGEILIPVNYSQIEQLKTTKVFPETENNTIIARKYWKASLKRKKCLYEYDGIKLMEEEYSDIKVGWSNEGETIIMASKKDKYALFTPEGKFLTDYLYDEPDFDGEGEVVVYVKKSGKQIGLDKKGNEILPEE